MKLCPQCKTGFPDHVETCPTHGGYLSEIVDLKPGMTILNKYRIARKLGEGGFGSVYLASHILMDEPRALKFLSRQWSRDEGSTARFRREVRTLRQVRHKNVVDCGDLEQAEDDSLFFAMEFVDGPDMRDFLHRATRPFDVKLALHTARGIAEGMGAAHAKGMVHRDIKPENILMAREEGAWTPKIADFGIVATKESSTGRTSTGGSLLTWTYAAPEQWRGMKGSELDGRTDLYALGGVLFEMLTGQTVFDAENYEGWAFEHGNTPPRPPSSLRPDLANWKGLDALVLQMLAKNREDRPHDVEEVLRLLDEIEFVPESPKEAVPSRQERAGEKSRETDVFNLAPGATIESKYRIERKLHEGRQGVVYLAEDSHTGQRCALRFITEALRDDPDYTARLARELELLGDVRSKYVARYGTLERTKAGAPFYSMEYVDGQSIGEFLHRRTALPPVEQVLQIARGIAEGLGAAHALGLVHRDIGSNTVIVEADREDGSVRPKIVGFASADCIRSHWSQDLERPRFASLLAPEFAAPEQWREMGRAKLDGRTDLYALGGVLFEMLTGKPAFTATGHSGWMLEHLETPPRPPSSLRPDLAHWKGLDALVLQLLAKNRDDRPQDVAEVFRLLEAIRYLPPWYVDDLRTSPASTPAPQPKRQSATPVPPPRPQRSTGRKVAEAIARLGGEEIDWDMQFNPQTHIRLTKHIWIKRVPKGQIVVAVLVSIVGIALLVYGFSSDRPSPPKTSPVTQTFNGASPVGTLAPDFTVSDKTHSYQLSKLRGIVVVVNFWASWAPACAEELPLLQQLLHDQPGPMVLAISADASQKQYDNFIRINHLALDTFREPNQATAKLFHSEKWPETYIIDRQGVVRRKLIGAQDWSSPELREFLKSL